MNEPFNLAVTLTLTMLQPQPTSALILKAAGLAVNLVRELHPAAVLAEEEVAREVEARCNVFQPAATSLGDATNHVEWYSTRKDSIEWRFWRRYARYLVETGMPPSVVERLDESTAEILRLTEDPLREAPWSCRGMVVGQVQSGKTANYTGLICKAADAGYKMIVVLAGMHNSLRSQTQLRLDEGFLGFDTQRRSVPDDLDSSVSMGVGRLAGEPRLPVIALTNSSQNGDFRRSIADSAGIAGSKDPILLVIKKNTSILKNLQKWVWEMHARTDPTTGRKIVSDTPLLVIDDEADTASVNTKEIFDENGVIDEDLSPTKINEAIRQLLFSFSHSSYVGYTATPFANIYMHNGPPRADIGEDLFPRSFIVTLRPPTNYFGAVRVFGHSDAPDAGLGKVEGLAIRRAVSDHATWMPDRHNKEHSPGAMPNSLHEALRSFIVASAIRRARGQGAKHHSMLVHVTRFTRVQGIVAQQLEVELNSLKQRLRYGDGKAASQLRSELRLLWEREFKTTMLAYSEADAPRVSWETVDAELTSASDKMVVRQVNGTARDVLEYFESRDIGLSVVAVGGDKLSRGLTLEGLMVSYYLRASKMYDTLMQMGRWFGYRRHYEDACRLYTTVELLAWYSEITLANEELLLDLKDMAAMQRTPKDYGLKIRSHPDGLLVTAATKMRSGTEVRVSYSGRISETIVFEDAKDVIKQNFDATSELLGKLGAGHRVRTGSELFSVRWTGASPDCVLDFLKSYKTHAEAHKVRAELLRRYVAAREVEGELTAWTILLVSNSTTDQQAKVNAHQIGLVERAHVEPRVAGRYTIRRLVNPTDESVDLSLEERAEVKRRVEAASQDAERSVSEGRAIRAVRGADRGLLLLYPLRNPAGSAETPIMGFAISFPESAKAADIAYTVNNVYWNQEYGGVDD